MSESQQIKNLMESLNRIAENPTAGFTSTERRTIIDVMDEVDTYGYDDAALSEIESVKQKIEANARLSPVELKTIIYVMDEVDTYGYDDAALSEIESVKQKIENLIYS